MKQHFTSAATSINKDRLPAIYSKVTFNSFSRVLDYGCGKYTDHIKAATPANYFPYDPYNQPDSVNANTRRELTTCPASAAVCSNVLNVIDSDSAIADLLHDIASMIDGVLYVTVYEGTGKGNGKQTGPDQYQRNMKTRGYVPLIAAAGYDCTVKNGVISVYMQR